MSTHPLSSLADCFRVVVALTPLSIVALTEAGFYPGVIHESERGLVFWMS